MNALPPHPFPLLDGHKYECESDSQHLSREQEHNLLTLTLDDRALTVTQLGRRRVERREKISVVEAEANQAVAALRVATKQPEALQIRQEEKEKECDGLNSRLDVERERRVTNEAEISELGVQVARLSADKARLEEVAQARQDLQEASLVQALVRATRAEQTLKDEKDLHRPMKRHAEEINLHRAEVKELQERHAKKIDWHRAEMGGMKDKHAEEIQLQRAELDEVKAEYIKETELHRAEMYQIKRAHDKEIELGPSEVDALKAQMDEAKAVYWLELNTLEAQLKEEKEMHWLEMETSTALQEALDARVTRD